MPGRYSGYTSGYRIGNDAPREHDLFCTELESKTPRIGVEGN